MTWKKTPPWDSCAVLARQQRKCHRSFTNASFNRLLRLSTQRIRHKATHHNRIKAFACPECSAALCEASTKVTRRILRTGHVSRAPSLESSYDRACVHGALIRTRFCSPDTNRLPWLIRKVASAIADREA